MNVIRKTWIIFKNIFHICLLFNFKHLPPTTIAQAVYESMTARRITNNGRRSLLLLFSILSRTLDTAVFTIFYIFSRFFIQYTRSIKTWRLSVITHQTLTNCRKFRIKILRPSRQDVYVDNVGVLFEVEIPPRQTCLPFFEQPRA